MYTLTTKRDDRGRFVAMKLRRVINTWSHPDPYRFVDYNGNVRHDVGPNLPAPKYLNSPYQIILRFSTDIDGGNPRIRCIFIDGESHVLSYDDTDYWECDSPSEWKCLVYINDKFPFTNLLTGTLPQGEIPDWCFRPTMSNYVQLGLEFANFPLCSILES